MTKLDHLINKKEKLKFGTFEYHGVVKKGKPHGKGTIYFFDKKKSNVIPLPAASALLYFIMLDSDTKSQTEMNTLENLIKTMNFMAKARLLFLKGKLTQDHGRMVNDMAKVQCRILLEIHMLVIGRMVMNMAKAYTLGIMVINTLENTKTVYGMAKAHTLILMVKNTLGNTKKDLGMVKVLSRYLKFLNM
jgi:hypothetical protein